MSVTESSPDSAVSKLGPKNADFVGKERPFLIGGQWVFAAEGQTFPTYDPSSGEVITRCAEVTAEDIDRAVKAARKAFESGPWSEMTASERGRVVWKIGDLMLEHADELAELEPIYDQFTEGFETPDLVSARELLESLG